MNQNITSPARGGGSRPETGRSSLQEPGTVRAWEGRLVRLGSQPSKYGKPGGTYFGIAIADEKDPDGHVTSLSGRGLEKAVRDAGMKKGDRVIVRCVFGEVRELPDGGRYNLREWTGEVLERGPDRAEEPAAAFEQVNRSYAGRVLSIREYPNRWREGALDTVVKIETDSGVETLRRGNLGKAVRDAGLTDGCRAVITHVGNEPFTAADGTPHFARVWKAELVSAAPEPDQAEGIEGDDDIPF